MDTNNGNQNGENGDLKNITEQLYKQNVDLAVRNKTLSLLRELYQISISTLEPEALVEQTSKLVQETLELELVAVFSYSSDKDTLSPLGFNVANNLQKAIEEISGGQFNIPTIDKVSENYEFTFLKDKKSKVKNGLINLWSNILTEQYQSIESACHIKSSISFRLIIESQVIGVLVISLNRPYQELSQFEQDSIINIVNVIAVALDRSILDKQLKIANEKLTELDRRKTEFVSIASHQLRSPLTAIKGYSSMLLEGSYGKLSADATTAVDAVFQSSQRLVTVIEDFLNVTRIELGKMKYELSEFSLKDLAQKITTENSPNVSKKGLTISFEAEEGDYQVFGDTGKISQVISNVIDNSTKYTPSGSIKVNVLRAGDNVQVKISDTGVGMSPEDIQKIFKKFVRADGAGKVNISGTGLGMYVAKQIVDAHLGKIYAESTGKGNGSTFVIELPHLSIIDKAKVGITKPETNPES